MRSTTKYDYKRIFRLQSEGWTLRRIADRLRLDYDRLKKAVWRKNQELGITTEQRKYMEQSLDLGLWVDEDAGRKRGEGVLANIQRETEGALDGIAISYVIGLPPEMEFVYINALAEEVYQTRTEQAKGVSVWELMADPAIYNRVVNLEEYHQKGVMVAKALLEIGNRIGPPFSNRIDRALEPYIKFARARLPQLWRDLPANIFAIAAEYPKVLRHWRPDDDRTLLFTVRWSYRPDWKCFHVTYEPMGKTIPIMVELGRRLKARQLAV